MINLIRWLCVKLRKCFKFYIHLIDIIDIFDESNYTSRLADKYSSVLLISKRSLRSEVPM